MIMQLDIMTLPGTNADELWGMYLQEMLQYLVLADLSLQTLTGLVTVMYVFSDEQGYSKFGKYTGTGDADGPFVYTGFKPAYCTKKSDSADEAWVWHDTRMG